MNDYLNAFVRELRNRNYAEKTNGIPVADFNIASNLNVDIYSNDVGFTPLVYYLLDL